MSFLIPKNFLEENARYILDLGRVGDIALVSVNGKECGLARYFYQFAGNWRSFKDDPSKSPVDGHMLVALMAPRPLLLQTGATDYWSDPNGEFIAAAEGGKVYEFLGKKSLGTNNWPAPGSPILNDLGYYMHAGSHGAMPADYEVFIRFMKMHFFKAKTESRDTEKKDPGQSAKS